MLCAVAFNNPPVYANEVIKIAICYLAAVGTIVSAVTMTVLYFVFIAPSRKNRGSQVKRKSAFGFMLLEALVSCLALAALVTFLAALIKAVSIFRCHLLS